LVEADHGFPSNEFGVQGSILSLGNTDSEQEIWVSHLLTQNIWRVTRASHHTKARVCNWLDSNYL
jgi:hypothetical protein